MAEATQDCWARWVLERQFGSDPKRQEEFLTHNPFRDKVLDNAKLDEGDVLLDVGCGSGLIAFGALERMGERGTVIFSDISQALLDHCRTRAEEMGLVDRCRFVRASADDLSSIETGSVDVVTTRSVLIYVQAKQQAFREFYRVLKPGERLSIFEPINRFGQTTRSQTFWGYDVTPVAHLADKVRAVYQRIQHPETDPMMDFDERDLLTFAEQAGFTELHLEYQANITPIAPVEDTSETENALLRTAPNPLAPTLEEAIAEALTPDEQAQLLDHLRLAAKMGVGSHCGAVAFLWAVKHAGAATGQAASEEA